MFRVLNARRISQKSTVLLRYRSSTTKSNKKNNPQSTNKCTADVPGLSECVLKIPSYPVGFAGAAKDKEYKNPEYFCYHVDSFADSFVEMQKFWLPAPSNKAKN
ncbi:hypothetical protein QAD02_017334 [Eretmocerus hayati]|uniref:Uncharacterized protein n=1 Tax=Eretmocerus hayati TaxID=131215 RepID=A0ACC2PDK3_9HYME|nr:hypothetical protein QAD02_017334 [Eretmocerus hayati]